MTGTTGTATAVDWTDYLESNRFCKEYAQRLIDEGNEDRAIEVTEDGMHTSGRLVTCAGSLPTSTKTGTWTSTVTP